MDSVNISAEQPQTVATHYAHLDESAVDSLPRPE